MPHPLLDTDRIHELPGDYVRCIGDVFAEFGTNSQDSGNISYGIRVDGAPFFVKTTGIPGAPLAGPASPTHEDRVDLLRNAITVAGSITRPAIPILHNVIDSPTGPMLVYEWASGELLRARQPGKAHDRFRSLPLTELLDAINTVYDVLELLSQADWIVEDFYDGCLIYDFDTADIHVVDLDHSHPGPFINTMGRMFGSSRFMAPEEFEKGAVIDHRTASFLLGRIGAVLLSDNSLDRAPFRGSDTQHGVIVHACQPDPSDRYQTEAEFLGAWRLASPRN